MSRSRYISGLRAVEQLLAGDTSEIRRIYAEYQTANPRVEAVIKSARQAGIEIQPAAAKSRAVLVGDVPGATQQWKGKNAAGQALSLWVGGVTKREYYLSVLAIIVSGKESQFLPKVKRIFSTMAPKPPERNKAAEQALAELTASHPGYLPALHLALANALAASRAASPAERDAVLAAAEGRVMTADDGAPLGLVDEMAGFGEAIRRAQQAGDHPQRRGLAAARGPQQGDKLAGLDLEAHVIDGAYHHWTPEDNMEIQQALGADIAMVLDVCPPYPAEEEQVAEQEQADRRQVTPPPSLPILQRQ